MPLTRLGERLLREFQEKYGTKTGERIFYAKTNKSEAFKKKAEGKEAKKHG